jgi:hypothetical protein
MDTSILSEESLLLPFRTLSQAKSASKPRQVEDDGFSSTPTKHSAFHI